MQQANKMIYREMMVHPVLFTHPHPRKVMLINQTDPALPEECLKHSAVTEIVYIAPSLSQKNPRITHHFQDIDGWLNQSINHYFDVIIAAGPILANHFLTYANQLHADGILLQQADSVFQLNVLKETEKQLLSAGFCDTQIIHFPQPDFSSGWRSAVMAIKKGAFKRLREKDIFNKPFATHYYNFDMHKAALAIPEFMREKEETA